MKSCGSRVLREARTRQQVARLEPRHPVLKQLVQSLAIGVLGAAQRPHGLVEDGERRHPPHRQPGPPGRAFGPRAEDGGQRVHGDKSFATRTEYLGADVRHAGHRNLVGRCAGVAGRGAHPHAFGGPLVFEGQREVEAAVEHLPAGGQVGQHPAGRPSVPCRQLRNGGHFGRAGFKCNILLVRPGHRTELNAHPPKASLVSKLAKSAMVKIRFLIKHAASAVSQLDVNAVGRQRAHIDHIPLHGRGPTFSLPLRRVRLSSPM